MELFKDKSIEILENQSYRLPFQKLNFINDMFDLFLKAKVGGLFPFFKGSSGGHKRDITVKVVDYGFEIRHDGDVVLIDLSNGDNNIIGIIRYRKIKGR